MRIFSHGSDDNRIETGQDLLRFRKPTRILCWQSHGQKKPGHTAGFFSYGGSFNGEPSLPAIIFAEERLCRAHLFIHEQWFDSPSYDLAMCVIGLVDSTINIAQFKNLA
ncbi:MAG: hypothetical protein CL797_03190 [Chromatiales bacterium]|jgi:hypothetical protein|nr:hypothetical protein [Chromatiales bacterium]